MNILSIESSCDETAVAIVRDGREILTDCIASQVELHKRLICQTINCFNVLA